MDKGGEGKKKKRERKEGAREGREMEGSGDTHREGGRREMSRDRKGGMETQGVRETRKKVEGENTWVEGEARGVNWNRNTAGETGMDMDIDIDKDNMQRDSKTSRNRRGEKEQGKPQR